jgi:ubiquinone/menaquinone biosynthesis C-methylase UbiE
MTREPDASSPTVDNVKDFWESHVNNEYYTDAARASDAYFREIEERRYATHYNLVDLFAKLQGSHGQLLEVGCGIGVDSIQLAKCGFEVTAVDLTESALQVAKEFAARRDVNVNFQLGNAEGLDFPDESFDAVYSFGVLHHTPDIEKAVSEVHRVLRPGGTAYVMLYHTYSLVNLVHRLFRLPYESPRDRKDHCPVVYTFSRKGVRELFGAYSRVSVEAAYPFTYGFGPLTTKTPLTIRRPLGRAIGWHLMIEAVR